MAEKTTNFGLTKPTGEEFYDVNVQNGNMDIIDEELKKRIPCLAEYYNDGKSADELVDPFALIPVSLEVNSELYKIVGGTFAWVWTNFYIKADVSSRRMQIAMSYNTVNHKMAFRIYGANGWLEWKELATSDLIPTKPEDISAAPSVHTHKKSEITDFPESMTPTSHAASHKTGGTDAINPVDIGALLATLPTITDANESIATTDTCIKIERWTKDTLNTPYKAGLVTNNVGVIITASVKNLYATQLAFPIGGRGLFTRPNLTGSIYDWSEYGDFKSDGSKAITGKVLNVYDGKSSFESSADTVAMRNRATANDDTNSVSLVVDRAYTLARKLFLRVTQDGNSTDYDIYGEHNKPTPDEIGLTTETWTFTLEDGTTVDKVVYVG